MSSEKSLWYFLTKSYGTGNELPIYAFSFTEFEGTREQAEEIVEEFNDRYGDEKQKWGNGTWADVSIELLDRNEYTDEVARFIRSHLYASDNLAGDLLDYVLDDMDFEEEEE